MKKSLKKILVEASSDLHESKDFAKHTMVQIRLIHARKQLNAFIWNTAKVLSMGVVLLAALAVHVGHLMTMQNSMMMRFVLEQPEILLSSTGLKAMIDTFPFISFLALFLSAFFLYKAVRQFAKQEIIPLNSPLYELL